MAARAALVPLERFFFSSLSPPPCLFSSPSRPVATAHPCPPPRRATPGRKPGARALLLACVSFLSSRWGVMPNTSFLFVVETLDALLAFPFCRSPPRPLTPACTASRRPPPPLPPRCRSLRAGRPFSLLSPLHYFIFFVRPHTPPRFPACVSSSLPSAAFPPAGAFPPGAARRGRRAAAPVPASRAPAAASKRERRKRAAEGVAFFCFCVWRSLWLFVSIVSIFPPLLFSFPPPFSIHTSITDPPLRPATTSSSSSAAPTRDPIFKTAQDEERALSLHPHSFTHRYT